MSDSKEHDLMRFFSYGHLPEGLQIISKPFHGLVRNMDALLPDCEEKDVAMRKLLEAKDCAVRASIPAPKK